VQFLADNLHYFVRPGGCSRSSTIHGYGLGSGDDDGDGDGDGNGYGFCLIHG